jgi:16S rRNA (adenine1518-N6/adenine1519-N6)-dimethyltransferase
LILEEWPYPKIVVLTLQKEVAQRIVAKPPNMSLLAVSVQYYSRPEIIDYIPRRSFYPTPEVDSAIIKLVPREQLATYQENTENFFKIVRAGFSGKRKQLINSLARGLQIKKDTLESKLKTAGVDPHRRAETLTLEEWQKITIILSPPN